MTCFSTFCFLSRWGQTDGGEVTPLLLSRDTVVTKNKPETSLIVVSSGQRVAKGEVTDGAEDICWSQSYETDTQDSYSDYWFGRLG